MDFEEIKKLLDNGFILFNDNGIIKSVERVNFGYVKLLFKRGEHYMTETKTQNK